MMKAPTVKQAELLRILGGGAMALTPGRREWSPLLRHGWVAAEGDDDGSPYLPPLRITPAGLRALADAVERDGLPPIVGERRQVAEAPAVIRMRQQRDEALAALAAERRERAQRDRAIARVRRALETP